MEERENLKDEYANNLKVSIEEKIAQQEKQEKDQYFRQYLQQNYKQKANENRMKRIQSREAIRSHEQETAKVAMKSLVNDEAKQNFKRYTYTQDVQNMLKQRKQIVEEEKLKKQRGTLSPLFIFRKGRVPEIMRGEEEYRGNERAEVQEFLQRLR